MNSSVAGSSRLLNSALSSSRPSKSDVAAAEKAKKTSGNRIEHNDNNKRVRPNSIHDAPKRHVAPTSTNFVGHFAQHQQPPVLQAPLMAPQGPLDTVAYFEQMNRVAQMSGFRNAQEMLASQKEMVALMNQGPAAVPVPQFQPPYPTSAPPPHQQVFHPNKHYRANSAPPTASDTDFAPPLAPTLDGSVAVSSPQTYFPTAYRGRGRGHLGGRGGGGGRGRGSHEETVAPMASSAEFASTVDATGFFPVGGRGRGAFRGRGAGRGRGNPFHNPAISASGAPPAGGNKTWVREAEIGTALVSGR